MTRRRDPARPAPRRPGHHRPSPWRSPSPLRGGLGDKSALRDDYLDELLEVGRRPGYPTVARGVYQNLPNLIAAWPRFRDVKAPVLLVCGEKDWSRRSDREANKKLLPAADFIEISKADHFIALERPDVPADLLNAMA